MLLTLSIKEQYKLPEMSLIRLKLGESLEAILVVELHTAVVLLYSIAVALLESAVLK